MLDPDTTTSDDSSKIPPISKEVIFKKKYREFYVCVSCR